MTFQFGVPGVTHCLLLETSDDLVLVDTGLGMGDYSSPTRHVKMFMAVNRIACRPAETAVRQVQKLGFAPEDVQHIVLTHLHLDHAGGLPDFPWARVHVLAEEYAAAVAPGKPSLMARIGYAAAHWAHEPAWRIHAAQGETWFGLECVTVLEREGKRILLVPLPGHSRGHCGVAVERAAGWLLHCGDAFVRECQVDPYRPRSAFPKWAGFIERTLFPPEPLARLQALMREYADRVEMFCSHDPAAFFRLRSGRGYW